MMLNKLIKENYTFYKNFLEKNKNKSYVNCNKNNCDIHRNCVIPISTVFHHGGLGVVIGQYVVIGDNVHIHHHVTLGARDGKYGVCSPNIHDNVVLYCYSSVLGGVSVGENSIIGAYTMVLEDVPPNSVVVGIPGRIVE